MGINLTQERTERVDDHQSATFDFGDRLLKRQQIRVDGEWTHYVAFAVCAPALHAGERGNAIDTSAGGIKTGPNSVAERILALHDHDVARLIPGAGEFVWKLCASR